MKIRRRIVRTVAFVLAILVAQTQQVMAGPPSFMGLGFSHGGTDSYAHGVSGDGSVVVGQTNFSGGFFWTEGNGLQVLNETTEANGSSADGSIIVGTGYRPVGRTAYRWNSTDGAEYLGDFVGGENLSVARGVSANGSVVVGFGSNSIGREAFRWTSTTGLIGLGSLPGGQDRSVAHAVSADGNVVVGSAGPCCTADPQQAFRWESGVMIGLGMLPGGIDYSQAYGISADGNVVVGASESSQTQGGATEAFRWTAADGMIGLGFLPGDDGSSAYDASADGSVIVGASSNLSDTEPFLWDSLHGIRELRLVLTSDLGLDLAGWDLREARGVSDDGQTIVGWGVNPDGRSEAWIAHIPEPKSAGLFLIVASVLLYRRIC